MTIVSRALRLGFLFCVCVKPGLAPGQNFSDSFAGRQLITLGKPFQFHQLLHAVAEQLRAVK